VDEKDDPRTDLQLTAAINAGDWTAFDILYHRYRDWAFRLAWRFCGDQNDAADAVQEVFVYLAKKFPGLELRANLTTLLYPAVKHTALAIRRKRRRTASLPEEFDPPAAPQCAPPESTRAQLAQVLANLTEPHREVLLMRFVDDMSLEEIAAALSIPTGTVKSRLHHAIKDLRDDPHLRRCFADEI